MSNNSPIVSEFASVTDGAKEIGCSCMAGQLLARQSYSTVTDLAKFLGLSTSVPLMIAT